MSTESHVDNLCSILLQHTNDVPCQQAQEWHAVLQQWPTLARAVVDTVTRLQHAQQQAQDKTVSQRSSLNSLTSNLNLITNKLATSHSTLAVVTHQHQTQIDAIQQERDAARALCTVWEARWKEERRLREEQHAVFIKYSDQQLNHDRARSDTTLVVSQPLTPRRRRAVSLASSASSWSSASSSSASSESRRNATPHASPHKHGHVAQTPKSHRRRPTASDRLGTRQLVDDLARELGRVRTEADHLLAERDEEITRLEAERQFRKDEMAKIYASMDTILNLQHSNTAVIDDDSAGVAPRSGASATSRRRGRHSRLPSILDLPSVRAAALLARERGQQDTTELEAEVRELELEIAQLSGFGLEHDDAADESNVDPDPFFGAPEAGTSGSDLPEHSDSTPDADPSPSVQSQQGQSDLKQTIRELNAQVRVLRRELDEARAERAHLRRLLGRDGGGGGGGISASAAATPRTKSKQDERVVELHRELDRVCHLLATTQNLNASLEAQLASTQSHFESLAERVRLKLIEQKHALRTSRDRVNVLGTSLKECQLLLEVEKCERGEVERMLREVMKEREEKMTTEGKDRVGSDGIGAHARGWTRGGRRMARAADKSGVQSA